MLFLNMVVYSRTRTDCDPSNNVMNTEMGFGYLHVGEHNGLGYQKV